MLEKHFSFVNLYVIPARNATRLMRLFYRSLIVGVALGIPFIEDWKLSANHSNIRDHSTLLSKQSLSTSATARAGFRHLLLHQHSLLQTAPCQYLQYLLRKGLCPTAWRDEVISLIDRR